MVDALAGDADTNIISTPHIVTLDNEEAEIKVGQEVPFVTGQFTNTGATNGAVNPFQTIQRQQVGTRLKITPQINEGNGVKLTIEQESSSIAGGSSGAVDLVTNTRTITTSVFVNDGDVLVLGGLLDDKMMQNEQHVPGIGKIPGLGWLFRARKSEHDKSNLMVFIRPTILHNEADARFKTGEKYSFIQELQRQMAASPVKLLKDEKQPLLPPLPPGPEESQQQPAARARSRRRTRRHRRPRRPLQSRPMAVNPTSEEAAPLDAVAIEPARNLPFAFAKRNGVLFQEREHGVLKAIYRSGTAPLILAEVRRFAGGPVRFAEVDPQAFDARLQAAYESGAAMTMVEGLDDDTDLTAVAQELPEPSDLLDSDDEAPIIRLINALLTQAVKDNASRHPHRAVREPDGRCASAIDGVLREVLQSKRAVAPLVVSRIKVMSKLDIAEKRLPQDGRISLRIAGRAVDVRVSTIPSGHGERVVLRLLDKQAGRLDARPISACGPQIAGADGRAHPPAARHPARHRPDRLGQDDDALRRARADQRPLEQHHDGRGPDRVLHRRHRPDAGQHEGRNDVRARPARDPAPGSGRRDGRRDPRPRDGARSPCRLA